MRTRAGVSEREQRLPRVRCFRYNWRPVLRPQSWQRGDAILDTLIAKPREASRKKKTSPTSTLCIPSRRRTASYLTRSYQCRGGKESSHEPLAQRLPGPCDSWRRSNVLGQRQAVLQPVAGQDADDPDLLGLVLAEEPQCPRAPNAS
jgi:hypothetical protein